jgi:hypothetical protein
MRPARLNAVTASLFIAGSACFVIGSVPAYAAAVGVTADALTYVIGAVGFTAASFLQLLQVQTPWPADAGAAPLVVWRPLPHDRNWLAAITQFPGTLLFNVSTVAALAGDASVDQQDRLVWRPDVYGSTLFLVAGVFGVLAVRRHGGAAPPALPRWIAWLNLTGAVLFMVAGLAGYVRPGTGLVLAVRAELAGTLLGALCFLIGAALMFPAWRRPAAPGAARTARPAVPKATKERA